MSLLLSALIGHVLSLIESEIAQEEPVVVAALIKEMEVLVAKLEAYIASKNLAVAAVINPVVGAVASTVVNVTQAAGAVVQSAAAEAIPSEHC